MKLLFTVAGVIACLAIFVFLSNNPIVIYTIYGLSFTITILFRIYYDRIEITTNQAEIYSAVTTIVNMALFYSIINMRSDVKNYSVIMLIVSAVIGVINISCAMQLKNVISKNSNL